MSTKVNFFLNNTSTNPARNWRELELELNFDRDGNAIQQTSITDFEFVRENADLITANLTNGRLFEGVPLKIDVSKGANTQTAFDGYVDLTARSNFSRDICNVRAVEKNRIDWLNDVADSFTFEYLIEKGYLTQDDYDFIPYVINSIPNYQESAIALVSAYVITQQIIEAIEKVKSLAAELSNPFSAISAIIKIALLVIYLVGLLIALVNFIKNLIKLLIQPVKYHACMSVQKQMTAACSYLGLNFSSSIFSTTDFSKAYIMPQKSSNPVNANDNQFLGFTIPQKTEQRGEFKGTFGDLLRQLKSMFNAKIVIKNGTLFFERRDYNVTPPTYVLPDVYQPFYTTNADENASNYYIKFETDTIDKNTLQEYTGTAYQVILNQAITANSGFELMKGLNEVPIGFALAKRKTELTIPEKIVKVLLDVVDIYVNALISGVNALITGINAIIGVINDVIDALDFIGINISFNVPSIPSLNFINLSGLIDNRLNMLKIETDFTSSAKFFLMDKGSQAKFNKLTSGNETIVSAKYLYNNYHFINSFVPTSSRPKGNQYIIKEFDNVPFSFEDFLNVKDNNQITAFGEESLIEAVKWNPFQQKAYIRVRINTLLTSNFSQTNIEPNGR